MTSKIERVYLLEDNELQLIYPLFAVFDFFLFFIQTLYIKNTRKEFLNEGIC